MRNAYGETLLHLAVSGGKGHTSLLPFLGMLVREGGREEGREGGWNVRTVLGRTPWIEAAVCGNVEGLEALWREGGREGGVEVGGVDNEGRNALHLAVMYRQEEVVEWLVGREGGREGEGWREGVLLQGEDKEGFTPLHFAAMYNSVRMARVLLTKGGREAGRARTKEGGDPCGGSGEIWACVDEEGLGRDDGGGRDGGRGREGGREGGRGGGGVPDGDQGEVACLEGGEGGREGGRRGGGGMQVRMRVGGREVCLEGAEIEWVEVVGGWEGGREGGGMAVS